MNKPQDSLINLERYPLHNAASSQYRQLVERCSAEYRTAGLCVLPEFLHPQQLEQMQLEANACLADTYFSETRHSV
ncbi:MAG: hypothetical protein AAF404_08840 [Pseudomonadota bacterium]